jgi:N-methylhydantoinase A/oxoprolinase/acetone carboxylase beta subunit
MPWFRAASMVLASTTLEMNQLLEGKMETMSLR